MSDDAGPLEGRLASQPDAELHESFLRLVLDLVLKEAVFDGTRRDARVVEWTEPPALARLLGADGRLPEEPQSEQHLLDQLRKVVRYSVKTGHPHFVNQLFSCVDPYGLAAQWVTDALNPSVYTYEVAPVFTLLEAQLLREMRLAVGLDGDHGDGLFCPGGSAANLCAMHCARHRCLPNLKETGTFGAPRLVVFTSRDAHYSIQKAAYVMGVGGDNVYLIDVDAEGRMDLNHLRREIERALNENARPFMVSATAGTTVLGAMDPLDGVADLCAEFGLWMHVDAAWGGGVVMSARHRHLVRGIERADSVTWNPHKLLAVPQQCSALLVRHAGVLHAANSASATYLFQKDKFYDSIWDVGDKYLQCGRRADVLKFWFMWQAKGRINLEKHVDTLFQNADYFTQVVGQRPGFQLVLQRPSLVNVCFWYLPPSLRGRQEDPDYQNRLNKVAPKIKERMVKAGTMMITYQPLRDWPNFFRLVLQNSATTRHDMDFFVDEIERLGSDL